MNECVIFWDAAAISLEYGIMGLCLGGQKSQSIDGMRQVKKPATGVVGRDGLARRGNEKIKLIRA